jgi:hypothetical protein
MHLLSATNPTGIELETVKNTGDNEKFEVIDI